MFEVYNSTGYDLYQPFENIDCWVIDCRDNNEFDGTLKEVVQYMLDKLDFGFDDIEDGVNLLADNIDKHNAIHFGIYKTCIYTFKKEENHGQRAS